MNNEKYSTRAVASVIATIPLPLLFFPRSSMSEKLSCFFSHSFSTLLFFLFFEICLQQSKRCSDLCAWECRKGQTPALGANGGGAGSPRECPGVTMGAAISHCNSSFPGCTRKPRPCSRRTAVNLARKNSHA